MSKKKKGKSESESETETESTTNGKPNGDDQPHAPKPREYSSGPGAAGTTVAGPPQPDGGESEPESEADKVTHESGSGEPEESPV